jgi:hypothetical protein
MLPKAIKTLRPIAAVCAALSALVSTPIHAADADIAVVGPVDSINCAAKVIRILGIDFRANNRTNAALVCGLERRAGLTYVSATGKLDAKGVVDLVNSRLILAEGYVAGSSAVYLKGSITKSDSLTGKVSVSGAIINTSAGTPSVGSTIEVLGIQPLVGGEILPASIAISKDSGLMSSTGSGVLNLSSTGSGTAKFSSTGSGVASLSSTGSGVAALISSTGSGRSKLSSTGSGAAKLSSTGSGVERFSSTGSGVASLSSTGSGIN